MVVKAIRDSVLSFLDSVELIGGFHGKDILTSLLAEGLNRDGHEKECNT